MNILLEILYIIPFSDSSRKAQRGGNGLCVDIKEDEIIMKEDVIEKEASSLKDDPKPRRKGGLEFRIDETPPLHIAFAYAFQVILFNFQRNSFCNGSWRGRGNCHVSAYIK